MSVPDTGYVIDKKARVALERALIEGNHRERVMGVYWELENDLWVSPRKSKKLHPIDDMKAKVALFVWVNGARRTTIAPCNVLTTKNLESN